MRFKAALLLLGVSLWLPAQMRLSVEQLMAFIRSSIKLKQEDKQVAGYLRHVKLSERLDDRVVEQLQGEGAGPKTVEALHELRDETKELPAPKGLALEPPKAPVIPPPSAAEQHRIIESAREYALNYTKSLPDYICTKVLRRYVDPSGSDYWRQMDTITVRLSYFEQKEQNKVVLVNNRAITTDIPLESLGGATSTGEFGALLQEIFEPETQTTFQWLRWATLRGRRTHVFAYQVEQSRSHWHVSYHKTDEVVPGYHGLVYVAADGPTVLRVTLEAELPASFPLKAASTVLDYDTAEISGHDYILPLKAEVRMREPRYMAKNDVEFRLYRKFTTESSITFDTPDPLPEDKTKEQPPQ